MNPAEFVFFAIVVVLLLVLAGFFSWRQLRTLRYLREHPELDSEERLYQRGQARRRLVCSALMVVLAGLLAGAYYFEGPLNQFFRNREEQRAEQKAQQPDRPAPAEDNDLPRGFIAYWLGILLVITCMVLLMIMDVRAIARFGMRQRRQLREDFRTTLADEVARLRGRRNGQQ